MLLGNRRRNRLAACAEGEQGRVGGLSTDTCTVVLTAFLDGRTELLLRQGASTPAPKSY